jgi:hypothetical protein
MFCVRLVGVYILYGTDLRRTEQSNFQTKKTFFPNHAASSRMYFNIQHAPIAREEKGSVCANFFF